MGEGFTDQSVDLLGVGFGPAGIALAAAVCDWREANPDAPWERVAFLERRSDSGWHSGQLLPGTTLQHNYFRDFATPRNPRSRFTFANYLWEKGRLFDFGLMEGPALRVEWNDYVSWAAEMLSDLVTYDAGVESIELCETGDGGQLLRVRTADDQWIARSLVLSTGHLPHIPDQFRPFLGERFFHSTRFLPEVQKLDALEPLTFAVIGSGQSAAEILVYLHDHFPSATMHSIHRKGAFKLLDHGPFGHKIYSPQETEYFYNLSPTQREQEYRASFLTNYSGVDWATSSVLYRKFYEDKVRGRERIIVHDRQLIRDVRCNERYRLQLADAYTADGRELDSDVVVVCTGFREEVFPRLIEPLKSYIVTDDSGGPAVTRDYQVKTTETSLPPIYLNGLCERTHGLSDATSFSMMALKADRIYNSWRSNPGMRRQAEHSEHDFNKKGIRA